MNKIQKSNLTVDGNNVHLSMPIAKVDEAKRTVSGFATLDNVDTQGDIVLAEASAKAFARARGNLREMHQPIAVGKVIDFREDEYFDPASGNLYRGIFVTARVSEGAEDTWKKVLDGTLTGFSIGGAINDATTEFDKSTDQKVRFIKDYDLTELSLVDNPANPFANIKSFAKLFSIDTDENGSVTAKGILADTKIETVFICNQDETVIVKDIESIDCPECGVKMENAGWFEEGPNRAEKVRDIVFKFLSPTEKEAAPENAVSEGGVEMEPKEEVTKSESAEEVVNVDETEATEPVEEEKAEAPVEVEDDESKIEKKIEELKDIVTESLEKSREATEARVSELEVRIEEISKSIDAKTSELDSKFEEFGSKLEAAKGRLTEFEKALEAVNSSDAVKKSADLDDEPAETVEKSQTGLWNGAFSDRSEHRFSVNNLLD